MITNKVYVNNKGVGRDEALNETERLSDYLQLSRKSRLHICLLTEEMLGMVSQIDGDFDAEFWAEHEEGTCRLCLEAEITKMSAEKKNALIKVSSSGKNAEAKGFMGKLKSILETIIYDSDDSSDFEQDSSSPYSYYAYFPTNLHNRHGLVIQFQTSELKSGNRKAEVKEEWDELEKSIVVNIADDVSVGVKGETVMLVITKQL